jgi:hypothetical protein
MVLINLYTVHKVVEDFITFLLILRSPYISCILGDMIILKGSFFSDENLNCFRYDHFLAVVMEKFEHFI